MSMEQINSLPWNGFNVISTFSGGGGSSTGYRMAGFRVLWANEFVEAARETYIANKSVRTIVDGRDIRAIAPDDVLDAIGMKPGELDILDGSPPCASFSTAGKRESGWGKVKRYSDKAQRTDDLFFEYARLIRGIQPKAFIAENVSGLIKGTAKGYFLEILSELKSCGYKVSAKLLDAQWLGVPQARQRLIFVGVRSDLPADPVHPNPLPYNYTIRDAIPTIDCVANAGLGKARGKHADGRRLSGMTFDSEFTDSHLEKVDKEADISRYDIGRKWENLKPGEQHSERFSLVKPNPSRPCPTVVAGGGHPSTASVTHPYEKRKFSIAELRRICGFPDDYILKGTYAQKWERCGRSVPPVMMMHIAAAVRDGVLCKVRDGNSA